jgi:hypothetical protein
MPQVYRSDLQKVYENIVNESHDIKLKLMLLNNHMKETQCCKAIHKEYEDVNSKITKVICTGCGNPCTLEDTPESWRDTLKVIVFNLGLDADIQKKFYRDVEYLIEQDVITQELARQREEMVGKIGKWNPIQWNEQSLSEMKKDIINLIKEK